MFAINPDVLDTGTPPIPAARAWMTRYEGAHGPAIDLSQAAPGSAPPPELLARLAAAAGDPVTARYGAIVGDEALRVAYAREVSAVYGSDVSANEVAITAGCNLAFVATVLALARAGDQVILPTPWYFNHAMALKLLGVETVPLPCEASAGFVPDVAAAEALITPKTRAIVLVTPNNPTGAIYSPATIAAFAVLARAHGIALILDETYRDFLDAGTARAHDLLTEPTWRDHVIQLYSFSKAYAVPGHRLGAIVAGASILLEVQKVLDTVQICPARAGQTAIAWAVEALQPWRLATRQTLNARIAAFSREVSRMNGWSVSSIGAYFAYVRHPFAGATAAEVAERMAVSRGILALPGSYFGAGQDDHLRFAFANADQAAISTLGNRLVGLEV